MLSQNFENKPEEAKLDGWMMPLVNSGKWPVYVYFAENEISIGKYSYCRRAKIYFDPSKQEAKPVDNLSPNQPEAKQLIKAAEKQRRKHRKARSNPKYNRPRPAPITIQRNTINQLLQIRHWKRSLTIEQHRARTNMHIRMNKERQPSWKRIWHISWKDLDKRTKISLNLFISLF